jgi:outer membrane protein W
MKMEGSFIVAGLLVFTAASALGADPPPEAPPPPQMRLDPPPEAPPRFRAQEFSIDVFGTASVNEDDLEHPSGDRFSTDGRLGLGLGGTYFFARHFGIEAEAYTENTHHSFVDNVSGSFLARLPIESVHLAPYLLIGGGYQFDPIEQWFAHGGVGLEFRFNSKWGIFTDARYVITEDSANFGLGRLGVRLVF